MTRYRRKPEEFEAWNVGSDEPCPDWILSARDMCDGSGTWRIVCADADGKSFNAREGDYISRCDGCFCLEGADLFERMYEPAEPFYREVYDWALGNMEGCDEPEWSMYSQIVDSIDAYCQSRGAKTIEE